MNTATHKRKSSRRTSSRRRSVGKFAKRALKKGIVINTIGGGAKQFPVGTTVEEIRSTLYPDTKFYKLPKMVFVDSRQNGYLDGVLPNGSYTFVNMQESRCRAQEDKL